MNPVNPLSELKLYPIEEEFVGVIDLTYLPSKSKCETIVILDRSGSMGENVEFIVQKILPPFFEKLTYKESDVIHLVTFDTNAKHFKTTVKDLGSLDVYSHGSTNMKPAIKILQQLMSDFRAIKVKALRILTISDGAIDDPQPTKNVSDQLAAYVNEFEISINSQAVRFFSSENGQPDTTALCCLLQLNNVTTSKLLDTASDEPLPQIIKNWVDLFANDGLMNVVELKCSMKIFRRNPWDEFSSNKIMLLLGNNVFWVKDVPEGVVTINGCDVKVNVQPTMTYEEFFLISDEKLKYFVDHLKILKIIHTDGGTEIMNKMVDYFKRIEESLLKKNQAKISNLLTEIVDEKVGHLNPDQIANFLREDHKPKDESLLYTDVAKATVKFVNSLTDNDGIYDNILRNETSEEIKVLSTPSGMDDVNVNLSDLYSEDENLHEIEKMEVIDRIEDISARLDEFNLTSYSSTFISENDNYFDVKDVEISTDPEIIKYFESKATQTDKDETAHIKEDETVNLNNSDAHDGKIKFIEHAMLIYKQTSIYDINQLFKRNLWWIVPAGLIALMCSRRSK